MATITPANLAYKDKDGDLGEVKSLTDTDVTLLNNALQDIEDLKLAYSPGFVKRDFSNVTQDGKDAAIGWGMPDYSAGISVNSSALLSGFTAPSDGILLLSLHCDGAYEINGQSVGSVGFATYWSAIPTPIPLTKNDVFKIVSSNLRLLSCNFYPFKGAN